MTIVNNYFLKMEDTKTRVPASENTSRQLKFGMDRILSNEISPKKQGEFCTRVYIYISMNII